jgi:hypothetical protein
MNIMCTTHDWVDQLKSLDFPLLLVVDDDVDAYYSDTRVRVYKFR